MLLPALVKYQDTSGTKKNLLAVEAALMVKNFNSFSIIFFFCTQDACYVIFYDVYEWWGNLQGEVPMVHDFIL